MHAPLSAMLGPSMAAAGAFSISVMLLILLTHKGIAFRAQLIAALAYFLSATYRSVSVAWDLYQGHFSKDERVARGLAGIFEFSMAICLAFVLGRLMNFLCMFGTREKEVQAQEVDNEVDSQIARDNILHITGTIREEQTEALRRRVGTVRG